MSLTNTDTWKSLIYDTKIGKLGITQQSDWDIPFHGSFDDAGVRPYLDVHHRRESDKLQLQWVLLLFMRIRDFIGPEDEHFSAFEVWIYFTLGAQFHSMAGCSSDKHVSGL